MPTAKTQAGINAQHFNTFAALPELDGATIIIRAKSGRQYGPYTLHCKPFEAGAETTLRNGTVIRALKCRDTQQITVTVNGKPTENYGLRFARKKLTKKRFGYT